MRHVVAIFSILLLVCCQQPTPENEKKAIRLMLESQVKCWNLGDVDGFMDGYWKDSSMQFISKKGVRRGWIQTLNAYKKHYPNADSMGKLNFYLDSIEFLDPQLQLGHITGRWELIRATDTPGGYFSLLTRKMPEGPKIIVDHTW